MSEIQGDVATLVGTRPQSMASPSPSRPRTPPPQSDSVNVRTAEKDFHALERKYSGKAGVEKAASSTSGDTKGGSGQDVEKAANNDGADAPFNLKDYLQSSNDASDSAGIKHKVCFVTRRTET